MFTFIETVSLLEEFVHLKCEIGYQKSLKLIIYLDITSKFVIIFIAN